MICCSVIPLPECNGTFLSFHDLCFIHFVLSCCVYICGFADHRAHTGYEPTGGGQDRQAEAPEVADLTCDDHEGEVSADLQNLTVHNDIVLQLPRSMFVQTPRMENLSTDAVGDSRQITGINRFWAETAQQASQHQRREFEMVSQHYGQAARDDFTMALARAKKVSNSNLSARVRTLDKNAEARFTQHQLELLSRSSQEVNLAVEIQRDSFTMQAIFEFMRRDEQTLQTLGERCLVSLRKGHYTSERRHLQSRMQDRCQQPRPEDEQYVACKLRCKDHEHGEGHQLGFWTA